MCWCDSSPNIISIMKVLNLVIQHNYSMLFVIFETLQVLLQDFLWLYKYRKLHNIESISSVGNCDCFPPHVSLCCSHRSTRLFKFTRSAVSFRLILTCSQTYNIFNSNSHFIHHTKTVCERRVSRILTVDQYSPNFVALVSPSVFGFSCLRFLWQWVILLCCLVSAHRRQGTLEPW